MARAQACSTARKSAAPIWDSSFWNMRPVFPQRGGEIGLFLQKNTDRITFNPVGDVFVNQMRVCTTSFISADFISASISLITRIICGWVTSCFSSPRMALAMLR